MDARTKRQTRSRGFTLLEVLIAMTLLMVVVALVATAMRMSIRSVDAGEKKIEALERFRSSVFIVSSQISSQMPLALNDSDQAGVEPQVIFKGTKTTMTMPSGYSIWNGRSGFVIVDYAVAPGKKGKLCLKASEVSIGQTLKRETILFDGLDSLSFQYFSKKTDLTGMGQWTDDWDEKKHIPEQIRLDLSYRGGKYTYFFQLRAQTDEQ